MNGQDRKLYNKLYADMIKHISGVEKVVTEIKTTMKERWNAHAERSTCIDKKIDKIFNKLDGLPCKERMWIGKAISILYGLVIMIIGYMVREYFMGR